tara:strand:+ start:274 stop:1203 length:930 start_codon:yes stop_codon:yes gene_type:complete
LKINREITNKLEQIIKDNNNLSDIWVYGSLTDKASDLDLIFVYNSLKKKIKIPSFIKKRVLDGTIIYIPNKFKKKIFLFEDLKVYSIKHKKKIIDNVPPKIREFRAISSFLERYYERRKIILKIKNKLNFVNLRNLKSLLYSYHQFYYFSKVKSIKINRKLSFREYFLFRKKFIKNQFTKKKFEFIDKLIKYDRFFCAQSIKILDKKFPYIRKINFTYRFNKKTKYDYILKKKNKIPFVLGQLFNYYASRNLSLSKKIRKDFNTNKKFYYFEKNFLNYLDKKINFLNKCYLDLKNNNYKTGLYRFTWYL